ncbi:MAG: hypothetical protein COW19_04865 [Zetaproteobacteria bacterium CG12_big_fil_rev_8_21_14_0_65_55_1124]|nr:MAG: transposase [Zetaproteobacteria bacterium CG1_02_55_237]PIS18305.1 MAG: hypothetical protein COT53_11285 [Zetaproteobacteria bacterium CG08_land_8_20_14_0_20_55_17]PIW43103.1 MAG: hypothetical protein COW19_04865 [Zetaproteobacteria bacterium CG12_big_fil_rev_8_21_14_0_65_55_1124]PIY52245.1 MAG: hypothetical protein COZ01_08245 [Zetaproteobacteria bacterium CG_4_10_14_0_8_um_filter_55_43]PIZ38736.1 MAG: hypothetical protein COY36_05110 [Zetaproteobacteria bacterium CG_4_10_14_0_2_um_fil
MPRKSYSKEFKAQVALDAFKGQKVVAEISSEHGVHPNQAGQWKSHALAWLSESFSRGKSHDVESLEHERARLYSQARRSLVC